MQQKSVYTQHAIALYEFFSSVCDTQAYMVKELPQFGKFSCMRLCMKIKSRKSLSSVYITTVRARQYKNCTKYFACDNLRITVHIRQVMAIILSSHSPGYTTACYWMQFPKCTYQYSSPIPAHKIWCYIFFPVLTGHVSETQRCPQLTQYINNNYYYRFQLTAMEQFQEMISMDVFKVSMKFDFRTCSSAMFAVLCHSCNYEHGQAMN